MHSHQVIKCANFAYKKKLSIPRSALSLNKKKKNEIFGHCMHKKRFQLNHSNNSLSTDKLPIVHIYIYIDIKVLQIIFLSLLQKAEPENPKKCNKKNSIQNLYPSAKDTRIWTWTCGFVHHT